MNIETVGTLMFFVEATTAAEVRDAVRQVEGGGNVVIDIIPIHTFDANIDMFDLEAVFLKVAGEAKAQPKPGTTNAG